MCPKCLQVYLVIQKNGEDLILKGIKSIFKFLINQTNLLNAIPFSNIVKECLHRVLEVSTLCSNRCLLIRLQRFRTSFPLYDR